MDRRVDIAISTAFIALGVFVFLVTRTIELGLYKDAVGPRAFFYGCAAMFIIGGIVTIAQRLVSWHHEPGNMVPSEGAPDEADRPASAARVAALFAACMAYAGLLQPLGYLLATPAFIVAALWILKQRNLLRVGAIAIAFTAIFYILFAQVLNVRIPVGPFTDLFQQLGWIVL
jgi:putative tricarboxylic transport membrane protein